MEDLMKVAKFWLFSNVDAFLVWMIELESLSGGRNDDRGYQALSQAVVPIDILPL